MPRIRFTADPKLPRDWADRPYRKDTEHDVSQDEANRWLRRGVAVVVPDAPQPAPEPEPEPEQPPEIPEDWRNLHHMARIALARKLAPVEQIDHAAEADAAIAAEIERRAAEAAESC